jgi:hypothetical protein
MALTIFTPTITYQYSDEGELSGQTSAPILFDEHVQERFRADVEKSYDNHPDAWPRLCQLMSKQLDRLPDNSFVQQYAWLCGIGDGGPHVAGLFTQLAKLRKADEERAIREVEDSKRRDDLKSKIALRVVRKLNDGIVVEVSSRSTGEQLRFSCRNIFDFGYVINADYPISEGREPGGICVRGLWQDYLDGQGWHDIRPATEFELLAISYLHQFPPVYDGIRM